MLKTGMTLMHEHTRIDLSHLKQNEDCNLDCFAETVAEYQELKAQGVHNIVDVTNIGMGRDVSYVAQVAAASGMNILYATGFYQDKFLPAIVFDRSVEDLAKLMIEEIEEGIDGTDIKASIIGEIGTSKDKMTEGERKVFVAAMMAAHYTGKNLTTHTTLGTYGTEQVEFFKDHRFPLHRVMIGHVDLSGDIDYVINLLKQGVYVELDTVGKLDYMPDQVRLDMLLEIQRQNLMDRVCLSMDITRKTHLKYKGGIGYTYLLDTFIPFIRAGGITKQSIQKLLCDNPVSFFNQV